MFRDHHCLLHEDCTAEAIGARPSRSNHDATLLVVEVLFGWTADSSDLLAALADQREAAA